MDSAEKTLKVVQKLTKRLERFHGVVRKRLFDKECKADKKCLASAVEELRRDGKQRIQEAEMDLVQQRKRALLQSKEIASQIANQEVQSVRMLLEAQEREIENLRKRVRDNPITPGDMMTAIGL